MVLVALRQQDKIVSESDDDTLGKHMLQLMEQYVKIMKKHCRRNCNHLTGLLLRLYQFLDCASLGAVAYNLVDFGQIKLDFQQNKRKIYHKTETPKLEKHVLSTMPARFKQYQKKVHQIGFKGVIDEEIQNVWKQHLRFNKDKFESMPRNDNAEIENYMENVNESDDQDDDESNDIGSREASTDEDTNMMSQMSMSQIRERMQQITQSQSQQAQRLSQQQ